jgi:hypothetical protein
MATSSAGMGLDKNWWARVHHYSHLYDFDDTGTPGGIRTPSQKFIFMGKTAAIRLLKMDYLSKEEAETFSSRVLSTIPPRTLNGAALALAFTTYDPYTHTFVEKVDPTASKEVRDFQQKRCWTTLVKKLQEESSELKSFQQDYGITAPDLLRYFILLRDNGILEKSAESPPMYEGSEEQEQTFY